MQQKIGWLSAMVMCVAVTLGLAARAEAHHSFAMFDKKNPLTIKGMVSKVEWKNPHVYLFVDVPDAKGNPQTYAVECASLNMLMRAGWKANSVKAGDAVTVVLYPLIDGQPGGLLENVTSPSGEVLKG